MSGNPTVPNVEADFWRQKYLELLSHTTQVTTALARPFVMQQATAQLQAIQKMVSQSQQEGTPT